MQKISRARLTAAVLTAACAGLTACGAQVSDSVAPGKVDATGSKSNWVIAASGYVAQLTSPTQGLVYNITGGVIIGSNGFVTTDSKTGLGLKLSNINLSESTMKASAQWMIGEFPQSKGADISLDSNSYGAYTGQLPAVGDSYLKTVVMQSLQLVIPVAAGPCWGSNASPAQAKVTSHQAAKKAAGPGSNIPTFSFSIAGQGGMQGDPNWPFASPCGAINGGSLVPVGAPQPTGTNGTVQAGGRELDLTNVQISPQSLTATGTWKPVVAPDPTSAFNLQWQGNGYGGYSGAVTMVGYPAGELVSGQVQGLQVIAAVPAPPTPPTDLQPAAPSAK